MCAYTRVVNGVRTVHRKQLLNLNQKIFRSITSSLFYETMKPVFGFVKEQLILQVEVIYALSWCEVQTHFKRVESIAREFPSPIDSTFTQCKPTKLMCKLKMYHKYHGNIRPHVFGAKTIDDSLHTSVQMHNTNDQFDFFKTVLENQCNLITCTGSWNWFIFKKYFRVWVHLISLR